MVRRLDRNGRGVDRRESAHQNVIDRTTEEHRAPIVGVRDLAESKRRRSRAEALVPRVIPRVEVAGEYDRSVVRGKHRDKRRKLRAIRSEERRVGKECSTASVRES